MVLNKTNVYGKHKETRKKKAEQKWGGEGTLRIVRMGLMGRYGKECVDAGKKTGTWVGLFPS
jgi:hypothetical protein